MSARRGSARSRGRGRRRPPSSRPRRPRSPRARVPSPPPSRRSPSSSSPPSAGGAAAEAASCEAGALRRYVLEAAGYRTPVLPLGFELNVAPLLYTYSRAARQRTHLVVPEQRRRGLVYRIEGGSPMAVACDAEAMRPALSDALAHSSAATGFLVGLGRMLGLRDHLRLAPGAALPPVLREPQARRANGANGPVTTPSRPAVRMLDGAVWDTCGLAAALVRLQALEPRRTRWRVLCLGADPQNVRRYFRGGGGPQRTGNSCPAIFEPDARATEALGRAPAAHALRVTARIDEARNAFGLRAAVVELAIFGLDSAAYNVAMLPEEGHKLVRNDRTWAQFLTDAHEHLEGLDYWDGAEREDAVAIAGGGLITASLGVVGLSFVLTHGHRPLVVVGTSGGTWGAHLFVALGCPGPDEAVGKVLVLHKRMERNVRALRPRCSAEAGIRFLRTAASAWNRCGRTATADHDSASACEALAWAPRADFDWRRLTSALLFGARAGPSWARGYGHPRVRGIEFGLTTAFLLDGPVAEAELSAR